MEIQASRPESCSDRILGGKGERDESQFRAAFLGPRYRFLRRYIERRPSRPLTLRQVDLLIRQFTLDRDLSDQGPRRSAPPPRPRPQCRRSPGSAVFLLAREGRFIIRAEGAWGVRL